MCEDVLDECFCCTPARPRAQLDLFSETGGEVGPLTSICKAAIGLRSGSSGTVEEDGRSDAGSWLSSVSRQQNHLVGSGHGAVSDQASRPGEYLISMASTFEICA